MASKKITELPEALSFDNQDLMIIEKVVGGTHRISMSSLSTLEGPEGPMGPQGPQGPVGPQGQPGQDGNTLYPSNLLQTVARDLGGFKKGDSLSGMQLASILEKLLCYVPPAPTFHGIMDWKAIEDITFEDLDSAPNVVKDQVVKPQTVYNHTLGSMFQISVVLAIPKSFGSILSIVDGANINIEGAYSWTETVLNVPGVGEVEYYIAGADGLQMANSSTVVKWNLA